MKESFSDSVRRFVLTSIPTVPHIETLLLLWREHERPWTVEEIARRLFVSQTQARQVAEELCEADLFRCSDEPKAFVCRREPPSLAALLAELDAAYTRHLRAVTSLIHSNVDRKAARFAQAFRWEKN